jgi:hypothetical protein
MKRDRNWISCHTACMNWKVLCIGNSQWWHGGMHTGITVEWRTPRYRSHSWQGFSVAWEGSAGPSSGDACHYRIDVILTWHMGNLCHGPTFVNLWYGMRQSRRKNALATSCARTSVYVKKIKTLQMCCYAMTESAYKLLQEKDEAGNSRNK